ncbi:nucleotidyltransferase domain-containing protein [Gandjariella thermophila]|uniref:Uncharacterized protein n=1 Tax=Gandjariella thermophila TaxID=1931992 RepID=A0A4D4J564_9PSEU|nr:nucleotidyltransferase domain-containing protein [Gandjariella thermophila]GDY31815.1 hypothetical protein GTS_34480 [Gandjariella thermophila]
MEANQRAAFATARALRRRFVRDAGYGLAYGSHPAGTATPRSDLDLVLIGPQPIADDELAQLIEAVCDLHRVHGFDLDTEVDYAVKVYASFADVDAAVSLSCFDTNADGHLSVSAVVVEPWFLNSRTFAHRLLLNALTSPHVFLGGDAITYRRHRERAEHAVALLAITLLGEATSITLDETITAVTIGPQQATGEDFLGYTPNRHLAATLRRGLARLARHGILRHLDGTRFEPDYGACLTAIEQLRAPRRPGATDVLTRQLLGPGTMHAEKEGLLSDEP